MATAAATERIRLTYADYELFPADGRRHEILDGEHFMTPSPNTRHQRAVRTLGFRLYAHAEENGLGEVFLAPFDVVLSDNDVVQPDILFLSSENASILDEVNVKGAPDLVVEVLSPSNRRLDEIVKRKAYEDFGVQEYWIADPELETVKVYCRQGAGFGAPTELAAERGETLTTPLLPGFELPLQTVFSR